MRGLLTPAQEMPAARRPLGVVKPTDPIFLQESGVTLTSCHYKACLPQPQLVHSIPKYTRVALCGVVSASLTSWLINCHLSHLSRVGCGVLGHLRNQGGQHTLPHNHGVERR